MPLASIFLVVREGRIPQYIVREVGMRREKLIKNVANTLDEYYELGHRRATPSVFSNVTAERIVTHIIATFATDALGTLDQWAKRSQKIADNYEEAGREDLAKCYKSQAVAFREAYDHLVNEFGL